MQAFDWKKYSLIALRRASYRTPMRNEALKLARSGRGLYQCARCLSDGDRREYKKKEIQIDHIVPCVDPAVGWVGLEDFAIKLFCPATGLAVLCKPCHKAKTAAETAIRAATRREKKAKGNV